MTLAAHTMPSGVEHKDVVMAILPSAAALDGLVLVFLAMVAGAVGAFDPATRRKVIAKARRPTYAILASFGIGLACAGTATWWLALLHDNTRLYFITLWLFIAQLASLAIATAWTVWRSMWG